MNLSATSLHCLFALLALAGCGGGSDDGAGTASPSVPGSTTVTVPGAPTIGTATARDAGAAIAFTAPASNGGATISAYTASCAAAGITRSGTGTTSPLTVASLTNGTTYTCTVTATNSAGTSPASASVSVTPAAEVTSGAVDATRLPLGDGKYSRTTPAVGSLYVCYNAGMGGASAKGPWFNSDGTTWNALAKIAVQGAVSWVSNFMVVLGATLGISGNGLPPNPTGVFPIASADPAYAYDRNPNSIVATSILWGLPANPQVAAAPNCTGLGAIGVLLDGVRLFNADDGGYRDAVAWEVQDACQGHPQRDGVYHHHSITTCLAQQDTPGQHSPLVGYIADGFGIYGNLGENGRPVSNADLDVCHGHTHAITVNGQSIVQYHYHQTREFPYTIGCFRGTPVSVN